MTNQGAKAKAEAEAKAKAEAEEKARAEAEEKAKVEAEEKPAASELEKLNEIAQVAGIDTSKLLGEIAIHVESEITPKIVGAMNNTVQRVEKVLTDSFSRQIGAAIQASLPEVIEQVETRLAERIQEQFGGDSKGAAAVAGLRAGGGINLFDPRVIEAIGNIITAFKQPSEPQAFMGLMNFGLRWFTLGTKFGKGQGSGDDLTKLIEEAFTPPESKPV